MKHRPPVLAITVPRGKSVRAPESAKFMRLAAESHLALPARSVRPLSSKSDEVGRPISRAFRPMVRWLRQGHGERDCAGQPGPAKGVIEFTGTLGFAKAGQRTQ